MTDNLETRPWRADDLDLLRASEALFPPETYPRRFLAGGRRVRPLHRKVQDQLSAPDRRWAGQIALHGSQVIALAECAWDPAAQDSPTLTVNVAEAWRHSGADHSVLRQLISRCLSLGLTTFNLDYAGSNTPLASLVDSVRAETGARFAQSAVTHAGIGHVTVRAAG